MKNLVAPIIAALLLYLTCLDITAHAQEATVIRPAVQGPSSSTTGHVATFNGATGQILQDGGIAAPPCSAFGTTAGTCAQGGVITGAGPTGSATVAPVITYNSAGQLTTVTSATVTPAVGSITGLGTGVATALGSNLNASGGVLGVTATAAAAWTPVLTCATGSVSAYSVQVGNYNADGNHVSARFYIAVSNMGTCSGQVTITGLPITMNSTANYRGYGFFGEYGGVAAGAGYTQLALVVLPNTQTALIQAYGTGTAAVTIISVTAAMLTTPDFEGSIDISQ